MAFFDTNVLLYAAANNDPRASKAEALSLAAALQGFNHGTSLSRSPVASRGMPWKEVKELLNLLCVLCPNVVPLSRDTHRGALAIAEKYGYSLDDALIASAALQAGCKTLYSEDMQDGQIIDRQLTIRNPFRGG
jgi:predicted nucleic acid-binding protein